MRNRFMGLVGVALVATLGISTVALGQSSGQTAPQKAPAASKKPSDSHDLTGFWDMTKQPEALNETSDNRPPMTDWAKGVFAKTKTGYDNKLSSGVTRAQKDWNDPAQFCDPTGFPRMLWNPALPGIRFVQTPEEVIQFFEDGRTWRDIWTDGRKLPSDDVIETRWLGYAVGKWDGDTLVVDSKGYLDRGWLDQYGSPHSDQMSTQERYHRPDHDHLEMTLDITDPKAYTATWKGDKKTFTLVEKPTRSEFNDFGENLCVWSEAKVPPKQ